jgi:quinol-cytochrome oxidoreductase complex cytochrome b subunit
LVTPPHIVPEWYFLPFYAILRSIPSKLLGVLALLLSIFFLVFLPFLVYAIVRSLDFRFVGRFFYWLFVYNSILLGWIGAKPISYTFLQLCKFFTLFYFLWLIEFYPLVSFIENIFFLKKNAKIL